MTTPQKACETDAPTITAVPGWLAHPVLSLLLMGSWLALSHSLAPVHILSGALIGLIIPRLLHPFLIASDPINGAASLRLMAVVLWDIIVSNITVAKLVLGPMSKPKPAWLKVPLATDHPRVNALFATIITTTPGTVSCVLDEQRGEILVHALNCEDAPAMIIEMKSRYEAPLLRIYGQQPGLRAQAPEGPAGINEGSQP